MKNIENKYPEYIIKILRQRRNIDEDDTSEDKDINTLSTDEVFSEVCDWEGLIGYNSVIKRWINDIYKINLDSNIY